MYELYLNLDSFKHFSRSSPWEKRVVTEGLKSCVLGVHRGHVHSQESLLWMLITVASGPTKRARSTSQTFNSHPGLNKKSWSLMGKRIRERRALVEPVKKNGFWSVFFPLSKIMKHVRSDIPFSRLPDVFIYLWLSLAKQPAETPHQPSSWGDLSYLHIFNST